MKKQNITVKPKENPDFFKMVEAALNGELPCSYDSEDQELRVYLRDDAYTTLVITKHGWRIE